ncbi:MAG: hypothetical protein PHC64_01190 [Candidatus Gastranaerophilales bacterium]|nr:hypothetical protein [Candidatus Gastranaerophilales bacterium]
MSQFIDSITDVKKNYKVYDTWEQEQADDAAKREYLAKTLDMPKDKVELTRAKAETITRAADLLDKRSEDNCQNMEQTTGIIGLVTLLPAIFNEQISSKLSRFVGNSKLPTSLAITIASFVVGLGIILWGNSKQKEASRVGRFQGKKHELNDVKNFVIYTPQQIEAAKILVKNMPDKKNTKSVMQIFQDMKQMSQDKQEYKKWLEEKLKNPEDIQKVLNTQFTPEQLAQGEEDKEIITNIIKDINIKAEEYCENVETSFETLSFLSTLGTIPIALGIKKLLSLKAFERMPGELKGIFVGFASILYMLGVMSVGLSEKKKASRVGRYVKKKEILNNPEVLMTYNDEQFKQAENVKAPKKKQGFFAGIIDDFKFLPTYIRDRREYFKYSQTEAKEKEKLYDALKQTDVTQEQLTDAKHLQEKTFTTFDKIDEMSQRYSEDVEAGTEVAKSSFSMAWTIGSFALGTLITLGAKKKLTNGTMPVHKIVRTISNIVLDKSSSIRQSIIDFCKKANNDKGLKEMLSKAFVDRDVRANLFQKREIQEIVTPIIGEFSPNIDNVGQLGSTLEKHFRKDPVSKWFRKLAGEIIALRYIPMENSGATKDIFTELTEFCKNYPTLIKSTIVGMIPGLTLLFGIPYAFSAWLTNIQKKAGKIGIMKAVNELDHPQLFVNQQESAKPQAEQSQQKPRCSPTSLLPAA